MKQIRFFILTIFVPLLFTSCLADYLNEKFGYTAPIYINYHSDHGTTPARKQIKPGTALTLDYLPELTPSKDEAAYEFAGWYLDKELFNPAIEGYVVNETITLYANWKYDPSKDPNYYQPDTEYTYFVQVRLFNPELDVVGFMVNDEYSFINNDFEVANSFCPYISEYEYIPTADTSFFAGDYYIHDMLYHNVMIIQKSYYKTAFSTAYFGNFANYLKDFDDYTYNIFITDYAPDLMLFSYTNAPSANLHLEGCNGLTEIPANAFYQCYWLKEIYLPIQLSKIGSDAFFGCSNLIIVDTYSIVVEEFTLGASAFRYCSSLENIMLPCGIKKIDSQTFEDCTNLKSIRLPYTLNEIVAGAFNNCRSLTDVYYQNASMPTTFQDTTIRSDTVYWHFNEYW
ncbi:MAG: leucine-rich repeat protein [Treponema sp.]|nr:leucine-rich repeat protein [Treponema sp.]